MQQQNSQNKIIQMNDISTYTIQELLAGSNIIELHFTDMTENERLLALKKLYQIAKKEHNKSAQDVYVRKTYRLKSNTIAAFAKSAEKTGIDIGKCVTALMTWYIDTVENKLPFPSASANDKSAEYQKQSYRVHNATAIRFHSVCAENETPAGHVLQALMDQYITQKGDKIYVGRQTKN